MISRMADKIIKGSNIVAKMTSTIKNDCALQMDEFTVAKYLSYSK
jgi:hypothetical protein